MASLFSFLLISIQDSMAYPTSKAATVKYMHNHTN